MTRSKYLSKNIKQILIDNEYRKKVNPKVNVFSVQTAGFTDAVIPEYAYRTNIMQGWTGKEAVFPDAMIKQWDEVESRNHK